MLGLRCRLYGGSGASRQIRFGDDLYILSELLDLLNRHPHHSLQGGLHEVLFLLIKQLRAQECSELGDPKPGVSLVIGYGQFRRPAQDPHDLFPL